ncbi:Os06g0595260 [Oryza sativa Japonica Group]|uniref:Os06g0595260 protein n=1 Tax=Oryza sativa subsp. japonica TaxID=39947 RepID=A0A0P0WYP0_ORYSJ|nr:Os06g0595260 [Oryza sativa Japonica Group]
MVEGEKGVGGGVLCSGIGGAGLRGGECYDPVGDGVLLHLLQLLHCAVSDAGTPSPQPLTTLQVMPLTSSLPSRSCRHRSISSRAAIAPQGQ